MGFFDALRRTLGGESGLKVSPREVEARFLGVDSDELPLTPETPFESGKYDRAHWAKKLKRVLAELPASRPDWEDLAAEARAMDFDPAWVAQCGRDEFSLLVRRAVADRVLTEAEHFKLDLARDLIGIPDAEAEAILLAIVAEAKTFFGGTVEGA
jgi:hypothetical protein